MKIFHFTRIKLTSMYVGIIMIVSLCFSAFVYRGVMAEVNRGLRLRALRTPFYNEQFLAEDQEIYIEIRHKVLVQLGLVNILILVGSAAAGYFLSGRTLAPIEAILEEQKRFVGDASHELRTPLTALKTEIEVALRNKLTLKDAKTLLKSNLEEVDKMQSLTSYLLSLTRYEKGDIKLTKEMIYLNEVVVKAIENLFPLWHKKEIIIKTNLEEAKIYGNTASLVELTTILLDNAIKYSHKAGVVLVKVMATKYNTILEVEDKGVGIKASDIPYIFNRFYRSDLSRNKEKVDGYGLGLSIAQSIIKLYDGKIEVKSTLGNGSTFRVEFPH